MKHSTIYLDNSATTQVTKEVYEAMKPYFTSQYFNPDSLYYQAREVKAEVEKVRCLIAEEINADPDEIYFTSGGCEANTWAMKIFRDKGYRNIVTTPIEHHSVHNAIDTYCEHKLFTILEENDLASNSNISNGRVDTAALEFMIKREFGQAVSIMHGNNEIGTVQPIPLIAGLLEE